MHAIRAKATGWRAATGAIVVVTGATAVAIDVSSKLGNALLPYLAVVVGLAFVLLALVLRSLLVPLKATAGFCRASSRPSGQWSPSSRRGGSPATSASTPPDRS